MLSAEFDRSFRRLTALVNEMFNPLTFVEIMKMKHPILVYLYLSILVCACAVETSSTPDPNDPNFKDLIEAAIASKIENCPIQRTQIYYIDSDAGDDDNPGTSLMPWNSLAKVQATISSEGFTGDTAFLFKRGSEWRELVYLSDENNDGVTFASYGDAEAKPLLNHFVLQYPSQDSSWLNVSGTLYKQTENAEVAFLRNRNDVNYEFPLYRAASVASCAAVINSFYYDQGNHELYVNLGETNPNSQELEAAPDTYTQDFVGSGIMLSGNGSRIDDIHTRGSGLDRGGIVTQNEGFKSMASGDECVAITNSMAFYGATHVIAHYSTGSGGHLIVDNCSAGLARRVGGAGATLYNSYAPNGGNSAWFTNCRYVSPIALAAGETTGRVQAFYTHTNGAAIKDMLVYNCSGAGIGLGSASNAGNGSALEDCRVVFVNCMAGAATDLNASLPFGSGVAWVNCRAKINASNVNYSAVSTGNWNGWLVNSLVIIDMQSRTATHWGIVNPSSVNQSYGKIINSMISFENTKTDVAVSLSYAFELGNKFTVVNSIIQKSSSWLSNQIIIGPWWSGLEEQPLLFNNAYAGVRSDLGGSGADLGDAIVDNSSVYFEAEDVYRGALNFYALNSALAGKGSALYALPYDLFWQPRNESNPGIGPVEDYRSSRSIVGGIADDDNFDGLPNIVNYALGSGGGLKLSLGDGGVVSRFYRDENLTDISYRLEAANDLSEGEDGWDTLYDSSLDFSVNADGDFQEVPDSISGNRFYRLKVSYHQPSGLICLVALGGILVDLL